MYSVNKDVIIIDNREHLFDYDIREVIPYKESFIVLLDIPYDSDTINNIYCIDSKAQLSWRVEDLRSTQLGYKDYLPYEGMSLKEDILLATDFYGRRFRINPDTGKVLESGDKNMRLW